jgi:hypothetical protein
VPRAGDSGRGGAVTGTISVPNAARVLRSGDTADRRLVDPDRMIAAGRCSSGTGADRGQKSTYTFTGTYNTNNTRVDVTVKATVTG